MSVTKSEELDLVTTAYQLIYDTVIENPLLFSKPTFSELISAIVFNTLSIQLTEISHDSKMEHIINDAIIDAFEMFYINHAPKRESGDTYIIREPDISSMKKKIDYLESVPQPDQRTDEWYHFRHKYLTASSLWKVFSTESARNNLIYNKCAPINTAKYKSCSLDSPMHWGNKYEPVSILWYEHKYGTKVSDFGCIPHEDIEFIAASPDGINTCPKSSRYGRMLEVKNIVNRVISGIPKLDYWIQMQIQMEVCNLEECDFLETRFTQYDDNDAFEEDGTFTHSEDGMLKGIIMHFSKDDNSPIYEYPPLYQSKEEFCEWENTMMEKYSSYTWIQNLYWKLAEISCILVLRNKFWFDAVRPQLDDFWDIIKYEKINGYQHREPKQRKKQAFTSALSQPPLKCNIDISKLLLQDGVTSSDKSRDKSSDKSRDKSSDKSRDKSSDKSCIGNTPDNNMKTISLNIVTQQTTDAIVD